MPYSLLAEGDAYLVRFGAPLSPGPMQITYFDFCAPVAGTVVSRTVNVGPPVTLPTTLGVVTVNPQARFVGDLDPCSFPAGVYAGVVLEPSAEMVPFLAVARWTVTYGEETMVGYGQIPGPRCLFSIAGTCAAGQDSLTGEVTIAAHVAGMDVDPPPVSAAVMARCPNSGLNKTPPSCGPGGAPLHPDAAAGTDAGADTDEDAGQSVSRGSHGGTGCSVGGQGPSWLALGVLTALGAACRRRQGTRARNSRTLASVDPRR